MVIAKEKNMRPQYRLRSYRPNLEQLESRLTLSASGLNNPGILTPQSHPFGASYSEWSARWWQWAYSMPIDHHPLFDTAPVSTGQSGPVWFLGASFISTTNSQGVNVSIVTRNVTVPTGTAFFVPIANAEASTVEGNGTTDAELRAAAKGFQDDATNMSAQIDGVQVNDVGAYRVQSPLFTFGPLPDNNVIQSFGVNAPAGTTSLSVGDGVYLMVAPLSAGQHTIHFHGEFPAFNFLLDITYNLTVVGGGQGGSTAPAQAGATPAGAQKAIAPLDLASIGGPDLVRSFSPGDKLASNPANVPSAGALQGIVAPVSPSSVPMPGTAQSDTRAVSLVHSQGAGDQAFDQVLLGAGDSGLADSL
jgi:hypothetical protein